VERELEEYRGQFEAVLREARAVVAECGAGRLEWRSSPKRWSVAECLNHLNVTVTKYLPRIEAMVAQGRREGLEAQGPFRHPFVGNWFIRMMEPPPRRRMRVPSMFAPLPDVPAASLLPEFERLRGELLRAIAESDGLDLSALRTASPAARFFFLTLGQCFGALAAHDRRHLWQARNVIAESVLTAYR
jgi:DinB superfamily